MNYHERMDRAKEHIWKLIKHGTHDPDWIAIQTSDLTSVSKKTILAYLTDQESIGHISITDGKVQAVNGIIKEREEVREAQNAAE